MFFFFAPLMSFSDDDPVATLASFFRVRRDLLKPLKREVLVGTDLTVETADLLLDLLAIRQRAKDGDTGGLADEDGFVPMASLKDDLVEVDALLSRRVRELAEKGWVEVRTPHNRQERSAEAVPLHGRSLLVGITEAGMAAALPIRMRYHTLATRLLADVSKADRAAHRRVSARISARIRELFARPAAPAKRSGGAGQKPRPRSPRQPDAKQKAGGQP